MQTCISTQSLEVAGIRRILGAVDAIGISEGMARKVVDGKRSGGIQTGGSYVQKMSLAVVKMYAYSLASQSRTLAHAFARSHKHPRTQAHR